MTGFFKDRKKAPKELVFDVARARKARDQGMKKVLSHNTKFTELVMGYIVSLPSGWRGPFEAIRHDCPHQPDDAHAWGAMANIAVRRKLLVKVGYTQMKDVRSHGRETKEYIRP